MTATLDHEVADLRRANAGLQRRLDEAVAERDASLSRMMAHRKSWSLIPAMSPDFTTGESLQKKRAGSLALMECLVRLVVPPGGLVLDPFAGSGSTGIAAERTGRKSILIEREPENITDIHNRIAALA